MTVALLVVVAFNAAGLTAGFMVLFHYRNRLYNGVATRAVARRLKRTPRDFRRGLSGATAFAVFFSFPLAWTVPVFAGLPMYVMAVGWAVADLDDYLTGDDRWRRRWHAIRNRVRWRMTLPAPARTNPGTA